MATKKENKVLEIKGGLLGKDNLDMSTRHFIRFVGSSYGLLWIRTSEYTRCITNLSNYVNIGLTPEDYMIKNMYVWDCQAGVRDINEINNFSRPEGKQIDSLLPEEAIYRLCESESASLMFALDYHKFIKDPGIYRALLNSFQELRSKMKVFCVISPVVDIPEEIQRYFAVIDYQLPGRHELKNLIKAVVDDIDSENIREEDLNDAKIEELIDYGQGLTSIEVEKALALSFVREQAFLPEFLKSSREQIIKQNSTLQILDWENDKTELKGMKVMKEFCEKMISNQKGRGILLVGPPGSGKTQFAKHLGKVFQLITIGMDLGKLKGELVGQTERMTRNAIDTIESVGKCILLIDEVEKGLSGMQSSKSDGGTTQNQGATLLKWLSEKEPGKSFVIATANNIKDLPPEFLRAGRFDAIFYVGLPSESVRKEILDFYTKMFEIKDKKYPDTTNWTGAEIKTLCNTAAGLGISLQDATSYVNPIYKVSAEDMDALKEWARGRTIDAEFLKIPDAASAKESKILDISKK